MPGLVPAVKALPAAGAGVASRHFLRHQRHHLRAAGQLRQQVLADILDCRQAGHVRSLQRADHRIAAAQRGAHHLVHHLRGSDAAVDDMQCFAQQGELQPVADKARRGAVEHHRLQRAGGAKVAHLACQMRQRGAPGHHFHQRDQVRRMPEMSDQ